MDDHDAARALLRKLFPQPQPVAPTRSKYRATYDPAANDLALADEEIARKLRRSKPQHVPAPQEKPEPKKKRWTAHDAFSISKEKRRKAQKRLATDGRRASPGEGKWSTIEGELHRWEKHSRKR